jgi:imidazoleglycerol-phosphate dehydratase
VTAGGDLETGAHHTVEDVGIALGQALDQALGDRAGIRRYGYTAVPMDEALGMCAIDISGRPLCLFGADLPPVSIAGFDAELAEEFFRAVSSNAKLTLHIGTRYGSNAHHMIEACFKAFARALREAVSIDPDEDGVPSTKGTLTE